MTPLCPAKRLIWHNVMILSTYISGTVNSAVSFSGIVTNLNNSESNKINLSSKVSTLHMALHLLGNLFWAKDRYRSLK